MPAPPAVGSASHTACALSLLSPAAGSHLQAAFPGSCHPTCQEPASSSFSVLPRLDARYQPPSATSIVFGSRSPWAGVLPTAEAAASHPSAAALGLTSSHGEGREQGGSSTVVFCRNNPWAALILYVCSHSRAYIQKHAPKRTPPTHSAYTRFTHGTHTHAHTHRAHTRCTQSQL